MNPYFRFVPTVNPAEFGLALTCSDADLIEARIPAPGTTYAKVDVKTAKPRVGEFGHYKFTHFAPGTEPGFSTFYFVKPKTAEERNKPFRITPGKEEFNWPLVLLESPEFTFDPNLREHNLETLYESLAVRKLWVRKRWVPSLRCKSDVLIEEFLSDTPWDQDELQTDVYVETPVEYHFPGCDDHGFPACVHGTIDIPAYKEPYIYRGYGVSNIYKQSIQLPARRIHATTMATWLPHTFDDVQVLTQDLQWHRTRKTIFPPAMPRPEETLS